MLSLGWVRRIRVSGASWRLVSGARWSVRAPGGVARIVVVMVLPVPVMHEHVHQWARRQEQPGQVRNEMGAMFGNNEEAADDGEQNEHLLHSSTDDVLRLIFIVHEQL